VGCHNNKVQNINDYNVSTRHNKDYWAMIVQDRIALAFSQNFAYTLNDVVLEFQSSKPIYEPPCMVDLMGGGDDLFNGTINLLYPINLIENSLSIPNFQAKFEHFNGLGNEINVGTTNVYENGLQYDELLITPCHLVLGVA
jgi:hypothetical protein